MKGFASLVGRLTRSSRTTTRRFENRQASQLDRDRLTTRPGSGTLESYPGAFRDALAEGLGEARKNSREPLRIHVTSVDRPDRRGNGRVGQLGLVHALDAEGFNASAIQPGTNGTDAAPAPAIVVVMSPLVKRRQLPRNAVSVAWVADRLDEWLTDPRFNDHDLVLVPDAEIKARVEQDTSKRADIIGPIRRNEELARRVRDSLRTWTRAPKVALHIGARDWKDAATWGDTLYARALQKEFERRAWQATVHVGREAGSGPALRADIALHLHGLRVPLVDTGQVSVLWIISHPDRVTPALCESYDLVFVASGRFQEQLAPAVTKPVLLLDQATDPARFRPDPTGPRHELLFVGGSRRIRRPMLDALAGTTHDLAVYGGNWEPDLLDPRFLRGEWIPNEMLRRYYSSADIVLSDAWPDMTREGFISNRVYDALACGAFVISDNVAGIDSQFDGAVATYERAEDLPGIVDRFLAHPDERRSRADRGRQLVLERHTFARRVESIIDAVSGLVEPRTGLAVPPAAHAAALVSHALP